MKNVAHRIAYATTVTIQKVPNLLIHKNPLKGKDSSMRGITDINKKSSLFALDMDENLTTGSRTQLEYLIVSQILRHFIRLSIDDPELNQTHAVYCACVELSKAMDLTVPLGDKSEAEMHVLLKEYEKKFLYSKHYVLLKLKLIFLAIKQS